MPDDARMVCVARIVAAHGVRGALKLASFTEAPESVAAYGPLFNGRGERLFALTVLHRVKGGVVARAEGVTDRDAAEALRGTDLYVPRSALPAPDEDEFYYDDLTGLAVEDEGGRRIGRVRGVQDYGAGDVLEILLDGGGSVAVPFTREAVPLVDLAAARVVVAPIAGLRP